MTDVAAAPAPAPAPASEPTPSASGTNPSDTSHNNQGLIDDPEDSFESPDQKPAQEPRPDHDPSVIDVPSEKAPVNAGQREAKQWKNDKESEIERFIISMRPEERSALALKGNDLAKSFDPNAVRDSAATLPESVIVNRHMDDIFDLVQNRHENPNFRVEIGEKMIETNEAIQHLENKAGDLQANAQKPANNAPVENSVEMLLRILAQLFGNKSGLSKEEEENLEQVTDDLERMKERMQGIEVGMKTYRQEYGNKHDNKMGNDGNKTTSRVHDDAGLTR